MFRYVFSLSLVMMLFGVRGRACTTFLINKKGTMVFGKNYDWVTGAGIVCTNQRGLAKRSAAMPDGGTLDWISKYGSISFNQYGKEFPNGGMNEAGLVVELMWAEGTNYPAADNRPAFSVLQWIQYQLDNNSSVEQVLATDISIRISRQNPPLHYLVADSNGNAATIEFFDGKMVVHNGKDLPFPVLTNNPYSESVKAAELSKVKEGNTKFSVADNSLQRFVKACSMATHTEQYSSSKPPVDYAFDILHEVAQGTFTKWSIVYDISKRSISFKTLGADEAVMVELKAFDFKCTNPALVYDMSKAAKGNINGRFTSYNQELNSRVIEKAVQESISRISVTGQQVAAQKAYPATVVCK